MSNALPIDILKSMQDCVSKIPVIVVGSGASAAYGIAGMGQLASYLIEEVEPLKEEEAVWNEFKQLLTEEVDLESALHKVDLSDRLEKEVVLKTKKLILIKDIEIREKVILDKITMSLSELLKYLNRTATPKIKIVTTNYDRLIEYAIDHAGLEYNSGFRGNYMQRFNGRLGNREEANVELLKVHGSLDWYSNAFSEILALPDSFQNNKDLEPVMVTPGKRKYEHTHVDPFRSLISRVDSLFSTANSLLIIGFGFNDMHIQPKLMQKMRDSQTPIIIITKKLTQEAKEFIKANRKAKIFGIEESDSGSNLVFPDKEDLMISASIWDLDEFLKNII